MYRKIHKQSLLAFKEHLQNEGKSNNTIQKYLRDTGKFLAYISVSPADTPLSQELADAYVQYLQSENYSIASINSMIASINTYCRFAGHPEIYCPSIRQKKSKEVASERLTVDEYTRLLRTAMLKEDFRLAMLIQVLGNLDIRMNELELLTVQALKQGEVRVSRAGEEYVITITDSLQDGLYEYIENQGISDGVIFRTTNGKPVERSNVWKQLKRLAVDAGINPDKVYPQNLKQKLEKKYFPILYNTKM